MVLSLTLLKGTGTKITQLYLADAALATGQSRHYLLQRLTGCFATSRAESPPDCQLPRSLLEVCFQSKECGLTGVTQEPPGPSVCSVRNLNKAATKVTPAALKQPSVMSCYKAQSPLRHVLTADLRAFL